MIAAAEGQINRPQKIAAVWGVGQVLFCTPFRRGCLSSLASALLFSLTGSCVTTDIQQLESLGWKALDEGRQEDGRYCLLAESCGHFIIAFADTRSEAWAAACSTALRLTGEGLLHLPRL